MKIGKLLLTMAILVMPVTAMAVATNGQAQTSNSSSSSANVTVNSNANGNTNQSGVSTQTQNQTQTSNAGTSTQIQARTEEEAKVAAKVKETAPKYMPENSKSAEHRSEVANAVQALIEASYQLQNTGLGDQIRTIAQTQSQNQDKIGESIDSAETRTTLAKFFIGANYKELKEVKTIMEQNRVQLEQLNQIMSNFENEGDKLEIANQIIALQNIQLELKEQLNDLTSGFSLFGWISRWRNNY